MNRSISLPHFIRQNLGPISDEWTGFARTLAPAATDIELRNSIHKILFYIADDVESHQTSRQQLQKSHGKRDTAKESPGGGHGLGRCDTGFNLVQMISEYRALRATIIKLWTEERIVLTNSDIMELVRFNEAIDQLLAQSAVHFLEKNQPTHELQKSA